MDKCSFPARPQLEKAPRQVTDSVLKVELIAHEGQPYFLRQTQAGKLILTK